MASEWARGSVARAWCTPTTENKVMDTELAEAFADILDGLGPMLGLATNKDIIEELSARVSMGSIDPNYRTVGS
jgi:hypothetical protein